MNNTKTESRPKQPMRIRLQSLLAWLGALQIVLLAVVVIFLLYESTFNNYDRDREYMNNIKEHVNLKAIGHAMAAYATDHDGMLPDHVVDLHNPEFEYISADDADRYFISPFDEGKELSWVAVDEPIPTDWYMQGSYRFYPTSGLHEDDITDAGTFVIAYGPSQGDPPFTVVLFFDGVVDRVADGELRGLLAVQSEWLIDQDSLEAE